MLSACLCCERAAGCNRWQPLQPLLGGQHLSSLFPSTVPHFPSPHTQELGAVLDFLRVGRRVALYLARTSPQATIDHLAYEVSLLLLEEGEGGEGSGGGGGEVSEAALRFDELLLREPPGG